MVPDINFLLVGNSRLHWANYSQNKYKFVHTKKEQKIPENIDINKLVNLHKNKENIVTLSAVIHPARFGALKISGNKVLNFQEKPQSGEGWINGGFFVLSPKCIPLIKDDNTVWEDYPLKKLAERRELMAYTHDNFWQPMDTLREKNLLEKLWQENKAPWKTWI